MHVRTNVLGGYASRVQAWKQKAEQITCWPLPCTRVPKCVAGASSQLVKKGTVPLGLKASCSSSSRERCANRLGIKTLIVPMPIAGNPPNEYHPANEVSSFADVPSAVGRAALCATPCLWRSPSIALGIALGHHLADASPCQAAQESFLGNIGKKLRCLFSRITSLVRIVCAARRSPPPGVSTSKSILSIMTW